MYRIIDKRGSSKTYRLMLLAKETGAIIVCSNPEAFEYKAKAYGIDGLQFISYDDYWEMKYKVGTPILVDEIDGLLTKYDNIIGYCLTPDD